MEIERSGDAELPLRERKKLQIKRRIQLIAFGLLESASYEDLTVEEIATRSQVSPSTVYRHFGTKEGIFLWDEYDDAVIAEFRTLLVDHDPVDAMMRAVHEVLAGQFDDDRDRSLSQLGLLTSIEPLGEAMVVRLDELRRQLAGMVVEAGWPPLRANVFAGAIVSSFHGVVELWIADGGRQSLPAMVDEAMRLLAAGFETG